MNKKIIDLMNYLYTLEDADKIYSRVEEVLKLISDYDLNELKNDLAEMKNRIIRLNQFCIPIYNEEKKKIEKKCRNENIKDVLSKDSNSLFIYTSRDKTKSICKVIGRKNNPNYVEIELENGKRKMVSPASLSAL